MRLDSTVLMAIIPFVAAPLTTWLTNALKKASVWMNNQTPLVKRSLVMVIGILLNWIGLKLGVTLPTQTSSLSVEAVTVVLNGLLSAFAAMGLYHLKDGTPPPDTPSQLRNTTTFERQTP